MTDGLTRRLLGKLYVNEGLSLKQIAKRLSKGYSTIHYWMKKYNIPRRKFKTVPIEKRVLENLYLDKNLNTRQIAELYKCCEETIRKKLIKFNIARRSNSDSKTKYTKTPFSGDLVEKSYMLGLRVGDFSVKRNHAQIIASVTTTHKLMVDLAKKVFGVYGYITEKERIYRGLKEKIVRIALDKSFEFLLQKPEKIPDWILSNDELFFAFLAGYIDADGCWKITSNGKNGVRIACTIDTGDDIILKQITDRLSQLGFTTHFYRKLRRGTIMNFGRCNKDIYTFCIVKKNQVIKLLEILKVYSKHPEKLLKIDLIQELHGQKWDIIRPKVEELRTFIKENVFN